MRCWVVGILCSLCFVGGTLPVWAGSDVSRFSLGFQGGGVLGAQHQAVDGFEDTKFSPAFTYGGGIMYRWGNGFAVELGVQRFRMTLKEDGEKFGDLTLTPAMVLLKYQGMPRNGKGLTGHIELGGGVSFAKFQEGPFIKDLERSLGVNVDVTTKKSFVFEMGAGLDYFFAPHVSLNTDVRVLLSRVSTKWNVQGGGGSRSVPDVDKFRTSNVQLLLGLRYWF